MMNTDTLSVTMPTDREVQVTRSFNAPRRMVFEALTTPALTTLTVTILYSSQAARDGALKTNFASGMEAGYSVLADLLRSLEGSS